VVVAEAKVVEEGNQSSLPIGAKPIVHGGSGGGEKGRLRMGTESRRGRVRRRVRGHLTLALEVARAPAPTVVAVIAAGSDEVILGQAAEAAPGGFFERRRSVATQRSGGLQGVAATSEKERKGGAAAAA
jgi:hypothetical protein